MKKGTNRKQPRNLDLVGFCVRVVFFFFTFWNFLREKLFNDGFYGGLP